MRKITLLIALVFYAVMLSATVYLDETFNYYNGALKTVGVGSSWLSGGTYGTWANDFNVETNALSYSNVGGVYVLSNQGKSLDCNYQSPFGSTNYTNYKNFVGAAITTGTIYVSFLYTPAGVTNNQSQAPIMSISTPGTNTGVQVWVGKALSPNDGTHFRFGTTKGSNTSTDIKWGTTEFPNSMLSDVFLVVLKSYIESTAANCVSTLFINPTVGSSLEPASYASDATSTSNVRNTIQTIQFKVNGSSKQVFKVSGVRVSSTWAEAVATQITHTQLPSPTILSPTAILAESFTANWQPVANATGYDVKVYQGASLVGIYSASGQQNSSLFIKGLLTNTAYTYKVIAKGNGVDFSNSEESIASAEFTTLEGLTSINTNFNDGTWGTLYTATETPGPIAPTAGSHPTSYCNGFDIVKTYLFSIARTDSRGDQKQNGLRMDRQSNGGMIVLPTVKSLEQIEIHAIPGGAPRNFILSELQPNGSWTAIGTFEMTSTDYKEFIIPVSRAVPTKLRIENAGTGQVTIYKIITRTTNPALLPMPNVGFASGVTATGFTASWTPVANATGYKVKVYQGTSLADTYEAVGQATESLAITGLLPSTDYTFKVLAVGNNEVDYLDSYLSSASAIISTTNTFNIEGNVNLSSLTTINSNSTLIIASDAILTVNAPGLMHSLEISAGGQVIVAAGERLEITNSFVNNGILQLLSDINGTATLKTPSVINGTGLATVQQHLTTGRNWYFASPVSNATSNVIKGTAGNQLWERNVASNSWSEITTNTVDLIPAKGYVSRLTNTGPISFVGTLNNGNISLGLQSAVVAGGKFHLVGNPYPSYLDWETMVAANVNIMPTIWYRTKDSNDDYAFATVLINEGVEISTNNANTEISKFIPPMQAFWVRIDNNVENVTLNLNNNMRAHRDIVGNKFKAPKGSNVQMIRIELTNGINNDETIIYTSGNTTQNFDRYDALKMLNNNSRIPDIYSVVEQEKLVINGTTNFYNGQNIVLGVSLGENRNYAIKASQLSNIDPDLKVLLLDNENGAEIDLSAGHSYAFVSDVVSHSNRFSLLLKSKSETTNSINELSQSNKVVVENRKIFVIIADAIKNAQLQVFDTSGRLQYSEVLSQHQTNIKKVFEQGIYFVKITNNGFVKTYKTTIK